MGGRAARQTPAAIQPPPDEVPHTEPSPSLAAPKHSPTLTRRSGVSFRQDVVDDSVNYFELNFDIIHIVLSFLRPKIACVSKYFRSLADDNLYWHAFFARKTKPCRVPREHLGNWKNLYQHAKEASSLQELLGTLMHGATITIPPGFYPAMSFGAVQAPGQAEDFLQLVGVPRVNEPVVFETIAAGGLISVFGAASISNCIVRHRYMRPPEDKSAQCAICSLVLENCEVSAGTRGLYGVYGAEKSTITVRNCRIHDIMGPAVIAWKGSKAIIEHCHFESTDGVEGMEESEVTIRDTQIYKLRNNGVQLGLRSIGRLERCKLTDGGGQGVQAEGQSLDVIDCDITSFQFSGVRSNDTGTAITISDSRISKCATGTLIDTAAKATITSSCIRLCTTAVEVSDGGNVAVSQCQLVQNRCGVAVSYQGPGAQAVLRDCIIRKNEVGVRVAVEAKAEVRSCDIRENSRFGVYVTRFEGEGDPTLADIYAKDNDIAVSGTRNIFIDELPKMPEVKTEGEVIAQEVKVAVQRKVCTFQLTGSHYRNQKVWRCLSCKLTGSRGMCDVCRITCHADHEVVQESILSFFCDCGAEGFCEVFARNKRALENARLHTNP